MWRVLDVYESALDYPWDSDVLERDFGAATTRGAETSDGVFERAFERGAVTLDCNTFTATFD